VGPCRVLLRTLPRDLLTLPSMYKAALSLPEKYGYPRDRGVVAGGPALEVTRWALLFTKLGCLRCAQYRSLKIPTLRLKNLGNLNTNCL